MTAPRAGGVDGTRGYREALESIAMRRRDDLALLRIGGRAPVRMLDGILTASIPGPETVVEPDVRSGRAAYSTVLTPKGRMLSDLWIVRLDEGAEGEGSGGAPVPGMTRGPAMVPGAGTTDGELLLLLPRAGLQGVLDHFARFLPPRFASVEEVSQGMGVLTVLGPDAPDRMSLDVLGLRVDGSVLGAMEAGALRSVDAGGDDRLRVIRSDGVAAPAWDLVGDRGLIDSVAGRLEESGVTTVDDAAWRALRIEAGRPAFGEDMDDGTIPIEAGLGERAIDHGKGCYTGQEVIVRIRDRGHVNRSLRGLKLGDAMAAELPEAGTPLFAPDVRGERSAGEIRSAVRSPRLGPVALAYVRREVPVGGTVRVGGTEGPEASVVDLESGGWRPSPG